MAEVLEIISDKMGMVLGVLFGLIVLLAATVIQTVRDEMEKES